MTSKDKKELLRSYGLNPDEFLSEPSSNVVGGCIASLRPSHWLDLYNRTGSVVQQDTVHVETFFEQADTFVGKDGLFDYISVTPPYTQVDYGVLMDQMSKSALIGKDTFIVVVYPIRTYILESCGCLVKVCYPSETVYKGYGLLKKTEDYLASHRLKNSIYSASTGTPVFLSSMVPQKEILDKQVQKQFCVLKMTVWTDYAIEKGYKHIRVHGNSMLVSARFKYNRFANFFQRFR
ncbi:hypothetical protein Ddye_004957 [Dipteronia dyeriana]|uniref:Uncharacterized protein n=1 Tax=Dipteronia dyeriana TaxID=168575 RepID=A0AAD9XFD1_9ROSI|nr:hypothetical protein Ddye_004957 [Dipteronia dyeriana]